MYININITINIIHTYQGWVNNYPQCGCKLRPFQSRLCFPKTLICREYFFSRTSTIWTGKFQLQKQITTLCPAFSVSHSLETSVYFVHNFRCVTLTAEKNSPLIFKLSSWTREPWKNVRYQERNISRGEKTHDEQGVEKMVNRKWGKKG